MEYIFGKDEGAIQNEAFNQNHQGVRRQGNPKRTRRKSVEKNWGFKENLDGNKAKWC